METFNNQLPIGSVILWFGPGINIPEGWDVCDGRNGRPDLINRVAMGTDRDDTGQLAGAERIRLSVSNLPPHTHEMHEAGAHSHSYAVSTGNVESRTRVMDNQFDRGNDRGLWLTSQNYSTSREDAHVHTLEYTGSGTPIHIQPKHCKPYYIIKTK